MDLPKHTADTRENLGLLAVMDVLEERERITQRELAKYTGLNLKKVNYCLHKLLEKGYVKFQRARKNPDKRAYLYVLTPSGLQAKSQLTYQFLKYTLTFYNGVEERLRGCLEAMRASGVERVMLYGASDVARILLGMVSGNGPDVVGVVDEDYRGHDFHGVPVLGIAHLDQLTWDRVLITSLNDIAGAEAHLMDVGVAPEAIWKLS